MSTESCACGAVFEFERVPATRQELEAAGWVVHPALRDLGFAEVHRAEPQPSEVGWAVDPHDEPADWDSFLVCPDCLAKPTP